MQFLHTAPPTECWLEETRPELGDTNEPATLLLDRRGVLQLRHVTVLTANFINPPTVGVAIWIVLVWSPDTTRGFNS
jgi:hypothetical protein